MIDDPRPRSGLREARRARGGRSSISAPAVAEPLAFAAKLFRLQGRLAAAVAARHADAPFSGRAADLPRLVDLLPPLLSFAAADGPPELAEAAARHARRTTRRPPSARLRVYWEGERDALDDYLSRAFLRPFAEVLAARASRSSARATRATARPAARLRSSPSARSCPNRTAPRATSSAGSAAPSGPSTASAAPPARKKIPRSCRASRATCTRTSASRPARPAALREVDRPHARRAAAPRGGRPRLARDGPLGDRGGLDAPRAGLGGDLSSATPSCMNSGSAGASERASTSQAAPISSAPQPRNRPSPRK